MRADCGRATTLSVRLSASTALPGLALMVLPSSPTTATPGSEPAKPKRSALVAHAG